VWDPSGFAGFAGTGYFSYTVICSNPTDCANAGYPGEDLVINQHYNRNNPGIPYSNSGVDPTGQYSGCFNDPDFGTSCAFQLANVGPAKAGLSCEGSAKSIGGWFNGVDTQANEIKQIDEVQFVGPGLQLIVGWVYETFGSGNFFQPNAQVGATGGTPVVQIGVSSTSPAVPIGAITGGNISSAVNAWFQLVNIVPSSATAPAFLIKAMAKGSKLAANPCFSPAWDGVATQTKLRHTQ
jgi:hypothetical protein